MKKEIHNKCFKRTQRSVRRTTMNSAPYKAPISDASRIEQLPQRPVLEIFIARLVDIGGSIIGTIIIGVAISEVQCKFKLGQNRSAQKQVQVIQRLKANGSNQIAEAMQCHEL